MELIVVAVLIQTLYYLAYDQHLFIVLFIGLSLLCQQYTHHNHYYLGIPIVLTHVIYLLYSQFYKHELEQFKFGRKKYKKLRKGTKKGLNKTTKTVKKGAKRTARKPHKGTKKGLNKTTKTVKKGAKRTARKAHKGMKKAQNTIVKAAKENARVVGTIQSGIINAYKQAVKAAQEDDDKGKVKETPNLDTSEEEKTDYDPKKDAPKV